MTTHGSAVPNWLTVDGIPVPAAIAAEGGQAVEQFVLEEKALAAAIADVSTPQSATIPTHAEGAET